MSPSATESNGAANGASTSNGADNFSYPEMATPYRVLNQYHSKPTKLRVACIGAGASGICLAYKMVCLLLPARTSSGERTANVRTRPLGEANGPRELGIDALREEPGARWNLGREHVRLTMMRFPLPLLPPFRAHTDLPTSTRLAKEQS